MIVSMYMSAGVQTIDPAVSPRDAIGIMRKKGMRRSVVTQAGEVVGMICHRDLTQAAERQGASKQREARRDNNRVGYISSIYLFPDRAWEFGPYYV